MYADAAPLRVGDPLAPPAEIEKRAEDRGTAIVLTCLWHRRDAETLANRYGAPLQWPGGLPNVWFRPIQRAALDRTCSEAEGLRYQASS